MEVESDLHEDVDPRDDTSKVSNRISSPMSFIGIDISSLDARDVPGPSSIPHSPLPYSVSSPVLGPDRVRDQKRERAQSLFANLKASKSMNRLHETIQRVAMQTRPDSRASARTETSGRSTPARRKTRSPYTIQLRGAGSTPELTSCAKFPSISGPVGVADSSVFAMPVSRVADSMLFPPYEAVAARPDAERCAQPAATPGLPQPDKHDHSSSHHGHTTWVNSSAAASTRPRHDTLVSSPEFVDKRSPAPKPKEKEKRRSKFSTKRLPGVLSRTKSPRGDAQMSVPSTPTRAIPHQSNGTPTHADDNVSRSAPGDKDRSLKTALKASASGRTRSEDRGSAEEAKGKAKKDAVKASHKPNGSSFGLGKAGRGFFSKLTRSGSSSDKAGFEEEYDPKVLKLPLIEQTRVTRIAKSYESCRDKTEFWMPALPWRCIDYLNGKCEDEGLYRVSGGVTNVRRWRRRFDIEHDINLLDEPDMYDSSVIASLFKEWIRELPEEIFPKPLQAKISATLPTEVPGKKPVPQSLRDELSNLPPFNYYLLFAITCHLSLLLSHEPKNKMTLDNLYRCFNQSLKLEGRIFYTLVGDWRQCWQGCFTENEFLRKEYEFLNTPFPEYPDLERRAAPPASEAAPAESTTSEIAADEVAVTDDSPDAETPAEPTMAGTPQIGPDEMPPESAPANANKSVVDDESMSPRAPAIFAPNEESQSPRAPASYAPDEDSLSPRAPAHYSPNDNSLSPRAPAPYSPNGESLSPRAQAPHSPNGESLSPRAPATFAPDSPIVPHAVSSPSISVTSAVASDVAEPPSAPAVPTASAATEDQRPVTAHALLNRPTGTDLQAQKYDVQRSASDTTGLPARLKAAIRPH